MPTWNHLAWRREARAVRHFCLSRTSGGSTTVCVSSDEVEQEDKVQFDQGGRLCLQLRERRTSPKYRQRGNPGCVLDYPTLHCVCVCVRVCLSL